MRLKKIKLAGFKSFVDPISIPISGNLIGIVGPNGCGKSNIIDAVRWVMGESSAKHLRGDSMADVIFSGSSARKPVGKASVELIFDNSDGSAPGQYASYSEISIRREAGRDGQSDYFLNRTKCRRKDIIDIFLGTGLGPHSYSILEQNAITRIIESKPEELRGMFEEAAGVSRYKERRRETENRIKHTRENLARVEDIRKELEVQINRLQRQSRAAQRYKELKAEERTVHAQLLGLRWRRLTDQLKEHDGTLAARETAVEAVIAELRGIEAKIEELRARQTEANDHFNAVQAEFYSAGAEITNIEQAIQHARDSHQQRQREQDQINRSWEDASQHLQGDMQRLAGLRDALESAAPRLAEHQARHAAAQEALARAEQAMSEWQAAWEAFGQAAAEPEKTREIQGARIEALEKQLSQIADRQTKLAEELASIDAELGAQDPASLRAEVARHDSEHAAREREFEEMEARSKTLRADIEQRASALEADRGARQSAEARVAGLKELQSAALGKHDAALNDWLHARGLDQAPRLAGLLVVESGWEQAVERVLGADLAAVCVPRLDDLAPELDGLKQAELTVVETAGTAAPAPAGRARLLDKVKGDVDLAGLLAGIYAADDLAAALALRGGLAPHESVVTRQGVWVGRHWIAVTDKDSARAGMLARGRDIEALEREIADLSATIEAGQAELGAAQQSLKELESSRDARRQEIAGRNRERTALHARLGALEANLGQLTARRRQIEDEQRDLGAQLSAAHAERSAAERLLSEAQGRSGTLDERRRTLLAERDQRRAELDAARAAAVDARDALHRLEIERQGQQTSYESTRAGIARLEGQLKHLTERRNELEKLLAHDAEPETELKLRLEDFLKKRVEIEARLSVARQTAADLEAAMREQQQARHNQEQKIQTAREALEQERMARQELAVRRETVVEQAGSEHIDLEQVLAEMPAEAEEGAWQQRLEELAAKINRLGPINLVAIEEYEEQSERKGYLDKQYEDLVQALTTLEDAIRKIDRETRTRFKETFDKVNTGFQSLFPQLFGGGHAYLELIGDEILDSGVRVMARPPGKRNSTIHLLSGGEKALTAVSLLFALFELNPAPFCLLDEVDAPLDDANVIRYSDMLKALSQKTQLVYITHNKISMEIAELLIGVTMSEPGVSRLVAVDVEQALEMVAQ
ncbi:MAG TPA: chromosome segregation protein SMC [Acidiferrobacterales bacterium]